MGGGACRGGAHSGRVQEMTEVPISTTKDCLASTTFGEDPCMQCVHTPAPLPPSPGCLLQIQSFDDLVQHVTCPMFGFKDRHDFVRYATPHTKLPSIHVPLFCLNSIDDIYCPKQGDLYRRTLNFVLFASGT